MSRDDDGASVGFRGPEDHMRYLLQDKDAAIARLTAERDAALRDAEIAEAERDEQARSVVAARAEVDALREDAERYRWLRSADNDVAPMIRPNGIGWQMLCGTRLDAAIDSARKAAATPTGSGS